MQEKKYDRLLNFSVVILVIAAIMLGITGYNTFYRGHAVVQTKAALARPGERDSLRAVLHNTVSALQTATIVSSASPDAIMADGLARASALRKEIDSLLSNTATAAGLEAAKSRITELQTRVAELQDRYIEMAKENRRLLALLGRSPGGEIAANVVTEASPAGGQRSAPHPTSSAKSGAAVVAVNAHLFAVKDDRSKETETNVSGEADKIVGTFSLKNIAEHNGDEVVIVVMQPDGNVIKNSVWDAGSFESAEGKKIFSKKLFVDPGDTRPLSFSLSPDHFMKGDYLMQIWYNGVLVGTAVKTLS